MNVSVCASNITGYPYASPEAECYGRGLCRGKAPNLHCACPGGWAPELNCAVSDAEIIGKPAIAFRSVSLSFLRPFPSLRTEPSVGRMYLYPRCPLASS